MSASTRRPRSWREWTRTSRSVRDQAPVESQTSSGASAGTCCSVQEVFPEPLAPTTRTAEPSLVRRRGCAVGCGRSPVDGFRGALRELSRTVPAGGGVLTRLCDFKTNSDDHEQRHVLRRADHIPKPQHERLPARGLEPPDLALADIPGPD